MKIRICESKYTSKKNFEATDQPLVFVAENEVVIVQRCRTHALVIATKEMALKTFGYKCALIQLPL